MWCYVIDQASVPQMTDADLNDLIASVLALCDINFQAEAWITKDDLKRQYGIMEGLEFGTANHKAYKDLMTKAQLTRAKLMGASTWIAQCVGQAQTPVPAIEDARAMRPWVTDARVTTLGAAYEHGPIALWDETSAMEAWKAWAR